MPDEPEDVGGVMDGREAGGHVLGVHAVFAEEAFGAVGHSRDDGSSEREDVGVVLA